MSRKALGRGLSALFPETRGGQSDLLELQIDLLDPSQYQPRTSFNNEAMDELAASIKARGIIQPLVVRRKGERFEIVAGERRWRAAQRAGLKQVPCVVKAIRDENVLEVSLIENIQRHQFPAAAQTSSRGPKAGRRRQALDGTRASATGDQPDGETENHRHPDR